MESTDAINLALALHSAPARGGVARSARLPDGVTDLLKVALGQELILAEAVAVTGESPAKLLDASRFYVEQQLLARECESDPWRVLGVVPHAPRARVVQHRRLLLSLVHPDRSDDWAPSYSDRLQRAWRALKSPRDGSEPRLPPLSESTENLHRWPRATPARENSAVRDASQRGARELLSDAPVSQNSSNTNHVVMQSKGVAAAEGERPSNRARWSLGISLAVAGVTLFGVLIFLFPATDGEHIHVSSNPVGSTRSLVADINLPNGTMTSIDSRVDVVDRVATLEDAASAHLGERRGATAPFENREPTRDTSQAGSFDVSANLMPTLTLDSHDEVDMPSQRQEADGEASIAFSQSSSRSSDLRASEDVGSLVDQSNGVPRPTSLAINSGNSGDASVYVDDGSLSNRGLAASTLAEAGTPEPFGSAPPSLESAGNAPSSMEASEALGRFSRLYASGNLEALLGLFSVDHHDDGGASIAAEYNDLFLTTSERSLTIKSMGWKASGDRLVGQGWYEARYRLRGKISKRVVSGRIQFELVRQGESVRFARVSPESGGA